MNTHANRLVLYAVLFLQLGTSSAFSGPSLLSRSFITHPSSALRPSIARFSKVEDSSGPEPPSEPVRDIAASTPLPNRPPVPLGPPPMKGAQRMDPLIASLSRPGPVDPNKKPPKMMTAPLIGEFPIDGSVALLVPAVVFAVVGFIMSINIIVHSGDTIVDALEQVSQGADRAALERNNQSPADGSCRGLCSNQQESYDSLKVFMESLGKQ